MNALLTLFTIENFIILILSSVLMSIMNFF